MGRRDADPAGALAGLRVSFLDECERQGRMLDFLEAVLHAVRIVLRELGLRVNHDDEGEICQQAAFLACKLGGPRATEGPWPVVYGHARNAVAGWLRKQRDARRFRHLHMGELTDPVALGVDPMGLLIDLESHEMLGAMLAGWLDSLPAAQREIFERVELGGRTVAKVALDLAMSEAAAWASLKRARGALRRRAQRILPTAFSPKRDEG